MNFFNLEEKIKNIKIESLEKKVEKLEVKKFKELNYGDYFIYYDYYKGEDVYIKINRNNGDVVSAKTGKCKFLFEDEEVIKIFYDNKIKIDDIPYGSHFKYNGEIYIKTYKHHQIMGETLYFATNIENGSEYTFSSGFKVEPVNVSILTE